MTNMTEAPEAPGDLLATGWAAPLVHPTTAEYALGEHACHLAAERDRALALAEELRTEIRSQAALIGALGYRVVDAEGEAGRLRARVAGQRETILRLRRDASSSGRWASRRLPWVRGR